MGKKRLARIEREKQEKKKRITRTAIIGAIAACVVAFLVFAAVYDPSKPADTVKTIHVDRNSDGSLSVPVGELSAKLLKIDFGYEQSFLAMVDESGTIRTAYDTCQECYADVNAQYSLSDSNELVCGACGNSVSVSELGTNSWGGCRPVSIPPEYRQDSEDEIVFSQELLAFAEEMFDRWKLGEYDITLESYGS